MRSRIFLFLSGLIVMLVPGLALADEAFSLSDLGGEMRPVVEYFEDGQMTREVPFEMRDGARVSETNGTEWTVAMESEAVEGQPDAHEYKLSWTLVKGEARDVAVGVAFDFKEWSAKNFVFVPAAVYDGNRFDVKDIKYPPYWYNKEEWRLDMPTTMTARMGIINPTLGKGAGPGRIDLNTGHASVPLVAFQSPSKGLGWMVQTTQGSRLGNHRLTIEENADRSAGRFEVTAAIANWTSGDVLTIQMRVYSFQAKERLDLMRRFCEARKDMNPAVRVEELPFSAAWTLMNSLFQEHRWDEKSGLYWLSDSSVRNKRWNHIWQLGWCGGGQATLALLQRGDEQTRKRCRRNLDVIFRKSQATSGFFYTYGNGEEFASFGTLDRFKYNESLVRSQGDWLYMAQRHFQFIEASGDKVPAVWMDGLRRQAAAFVRLWEKRGQFGQFVDVETGDICVGGSASGAIVPGGLALASKTLGSSRYLEVAEAAARKYYRDFVKIGYTTGGPGEILSAPDSESAFGLFESFMALYEVTGSKEWLKYADEHLAICASWTVSYDFEFPPDSALGRINARSCGAVWASVSNKHGAPGICTWSGDSLLKYYRATGDRRALELLRDISHGLTQYISREDHQLGSMPPGGICERVNLSNWEGEKNVGGRIFGSSSWVETCAVLTVVQIPGLYIQPDTGVFVAFDNIRAEQVSKTENSIKLRLSNPTKFPADVTVLVESSSDARTAVASFVKKDARVIHLDAGGSVEEDFR